MNLFFLLLYNKKKAKEFDFHFFCSSILT